MAAENVSSGNFLLNVLVVNVVILTMLLRLNKFGFGSITNLSNPEARTPFSVEGASGFTAWRSIRFWHTVWIRVMVIIFRCLFLLLPFNSHHPWKLVSLVSWLNCLILVADQCGSSSQNLVRQTIDLLFYLSALLHIPHAVSHGFHFYILLWLI